MSKRLLREALDARRNTYRPSVASIAARGLLWLATLGAALGALWCACVAVLWLLGVATW